MTAPSPVQAPCPAPDLHGPVVMSLTLSEEERIGRDTYFVYSGDWNHDGKADTRFVARFHTTSYNRWLPFPENTYLEQGGKRYYFGPSNWAPGFYAEEKASRPFVIEMDGGFLENNLHSGLTLYNQYTAPGFGDLPDKAHAGERILFHGKIPSRLDNPLADGHIILGFALSVWPTGLPSHPPSEINLKLEAVRVRNDRENIRKHLKESSIIYYSQNAAQCYGENTQPYLLSADQLINHTLEPFNPGTIVQKWIDKMKSLWPLNPVVSLEGNDPTTDIDDTREMPAVWSPST